MFGLGKKNRKKMAKKLRRGNEWKCNLILLVTCNIVEKKTRSVMVKRCDTNSLLLSDVE